MTSMANKWHNSKTSGFSDLTSWFTSGSKTDRASWNGGIPALKIGNYNKM